MPYLQKKHLNVLENEIHLTEVSDGQIRHMGFYSCQITLYVELNWSQNVRPPYLTGDLFNDCLEGIGVPHPRVLSQTLAPCSFWDFKRETDDWLNDMVIFYYAKSFN